MPIDDAHEPEVVQTLVANHRRFLAFRAREALRRQVAAACGTCAEHGCVDCHCARGSDGSDRR